MDSLLLAIDIGTSACKISAFEPDGTAAASCSRGYRTYYPRPGWAEQDPNEWWLAVCSGIRECLESGGIAPGRIAGVGIDGQSWSCIPVGGDGNVLCNTPIWMDTRAAAVCERINAEIGAEAIFAVSRNPFQPSYTAPKILWFRENRPELYRKTDKFLQSNGFIAYRLTGAVSQDISQGYGVHGFDMEKLRYDESLCGALGLDRGRLPDLCRSHAVVGGVTAQASGLTGLLEGTPVTAGGLDAACGTLGAGVCRPGETQEQGGQAGGMSVCVGRPLGDPALILSPHVVPGLWLLQGGTVGGGASLRWLAEELGEKEKNLAARTGENLYKLLDDLAATVPCGSDGVIFLPYLAGERSPIWDPNAKGVYFGLTFGKTRAHFFRALLEGAAYALEHNLKAAERAGVPVGAMYTVGGAANSRLWTQIKSDVTGKIIRVPDSDNATTLGAAMLAGVGTGVYSDFEEAVGRTVRIRREHRPDPARHELYREYFGIYLEIYERLKSTMAEHAGILSERQRGV